MISKQQQRNIVDDWQREFPAFAIYRPLHLVRRCGALVLGICLDRGRGDLYIPTLHYHCLLQPFSVVSLSMPIRLAAPNGSDLYVNVRSHERNLDQNAKALRRLSPLPIDGTISLSQFEAASEVWLNKNPVAMSPPVLSDIVLLSAWCQADWQARLRRVESLASNWPQSVSIFLGGTTAWLAKLADSASNREELLRTFESQIKSHKLQDIPVSDFIK